jgi:hypothetical protein
MSPRSIDGLYGGETSKWTIEIEQDALNQLLKTNDLIDLGSLDNQAVFTYEKNVKGKLVQFRCDLVLASSCLVEDGKLSYTVLHEVRMADSSFTDHSAILVNINIE